MDARSGPKRLVEEESVDGKTDHELRKHLAGLGSAAAQYELAVCYASGRGEALNPTEALIWFRKAADQRHSGAQAALGFGYKFGQLNLEKDFDKAFEWFQLAAAQGDPFAQRELGRMYRAGEGVSPSKEKSVEWARKAAEQGDPAAQYDMGIYAIHQYRPAMERDVVRFGQGRAWYNRDQEKCDAEAVQWFQKAADQGLAIAQSELGLCYQLGQGVSQSDSRAFVWYLIAKSNGIRTLEGRLKHLEEFQLTRTEIAESRKLAITYSNEINQRKIPGEEKSEPAEAELTPTGLRSPSENLREDVNLGD